MTRKEVEERMRFEKLLGDEAAAYNGGMMPEWARRQNAKKAARLLMRHGKTYAGIQEAVCNGAEWMGGDTDESWKKRQNQHEAWTTKREDQLEKRIKAIVAELGSGFGVIFNGDPRGCTIKVTVPSGKTNDLASEGIYVPGS